MGKKRDFLGKSVLFVIVTIAMILAACANEGEEESEWSPNIGYPSSLTEDQWYEGDVPSYSGGEQWFKFTATASTQYIHVSFRTLDGLYMRIYNSNGSSVDGSWAENSTGSYYNDSIRKDSPTYSITTSLTSGKTYYIRVWPYASYNQSTSGYYRIAFNKSNNPPVSINGTWTPYYGTTQLTVNQWANGNVSSSSDGGQWFKFTATAPTQYIHVSLDTYDSLYVQLYDSHGYSVGSQTKMDSSTRYTSKSLTSGQTYYINVTPYSSSSYGSVSYKIAFNTSSTLPAGGTHDIDSSLYGTWSTGNNNVLTVTFSADGVTWGGTAGNALNIQDAVWTAKDGEIKYTWNGSTTTAYNYNINSSGNLILSAVTGSTSLTLTKQ